MKLKSLIFILALFYSFSLFSQEPLLPHFLKIEIQPNTEELNEIIQKFIGKGQYITVIFHNEREGPEYTIEVFPEPPIILYNHQTNSICHINEGGIWVRDQVYLSYDERYLAVIEYSGSSQSLVTYDTQTCEKFRELLKGGISEEGYPFIEVQLDKPDNPYESLRR